jgi:hypothetical protein
MYSASGPSALFFRLAASARILSLGKRQGGVGIATVERLTVDIAARYQMCRFPRQCCRRCLLRAGLHAAANCHYRTPVAESRAGLPAVDVFRFGSKACVDLVLALLHAKPDFRPMAKRELVDVEGLADADANLRELGAHVLLGRCTSAKSLSRA